MPLYQYCIEDGCTWTSQWGGGTAEDDPATGHALSNPGHRIRGGSSELHAQMYYRQKNGENVTDEATTHEDWPFSHVAPGEVRHDLSEAEVVALTAELDALRTKVDEWSCDECGERESVVTKGVNGPSRCRECAGFTTDCGEELEESA